MLDLRRVFAIIVERYSLIKVPRTIDQNNTQIMNNIVNELEI